MIPVRRDCKVRSGENGGEHLQAASIKDRFSPPVCESDGVTKWWRGPRLSGHTTTELKSIIHNNIIVYIDIVF